MSLFSADFTTSSLGVLYDLHSEEVSYTHSQTSSAAESTSTYDAIPQTSTDVAGGTRAQQQSVIWRVRAAGLTRDPVRGDSLTFDGLTWSVVDAVLKRGGAEWRLTCQYQHLRG